MNWYAAEQEMGYRRAQAVAAGERSRMLRELDAMLAQQRRVQRMKLLASVSAKWQSLRRAISGGDDQSQDGMTLAIPGAGNGRG